VLLGVGIRGPSVPASLAPRTAAEIVLAIVLVVVVAIAEETVYRGYLLLRLRAITGSRAAAVAIATAIFAAGHTYEGFGGVIAVGAMGAIFSVIYLWRKSLVAPIVMHFIQDFIGLVLLPALGAR
jgi:membrane protease YdiL (CAAX protease family)